MANIDADKEDSGRTSKTFTVPLWPETADVVRDIPSHRWCCWWVSPKEMGELMKEFHAQTGTHKGKSKTYILPEDGRPEDILRKEKLKVGDRPPNLTEVQSPRLKKTSRTIDFAVTKQGIVVERKLYRFGELESFWIFYEPPEIKEVSVKSRKKILHYLKMPLEGENPAQIRKILIEYLPEVEQEESIFDSLARLAKF